MYDKKTTEIVYHDDENNIFSDNDLHENIFCFFASAWYVI